VPESSFKVTEELVTAEAWVRLEGVVHGFSTRRTTRERFFARVLEARGLQPVLVRQLHSDRTRAFDRVPQRLLEADALITATPGLALVVKTADCPPVLLFDPKSRSVGAVHARWRSTLRRLTQKTVGMMRACYDADPQRMRAVIGPSILKCCYQVGEEVLDAFRSQFTYAEELFSPPQPQNPAQIRLPRQVSLLHLGPRHRATVRTHLDLQEANRRQLLQAGLKPQHITVGSLCTACRSDLFHSYRRDGRRAGRLYAAVGLAP